MILWSVKRQSRSRTYRNWEGIVDLEFCRFISVEGDAGWQQVEEHLQQRQVLSRHVRHLKYRTHPEIQQGYFLLLPPTNEVCGKVMFSVVRVCLFTRRGFHVTITHNAMDLAINPPPTHGTPSPRTCSNLFIMKHVGGSHPTGMLSCIEAVFKICFNGPVSTLHNGLRPRVKNSAVTSLTWSLLPRWPRRPLFAREQASSCSRVTWGSAAASWGCPAARCPGTCRSSSPPQTRGHWAPAPNPSAP